MARTGRAQAGRALIDDAVGLIEHPGAEDIAAQGRAPVATALAPFDLKRALALVEPIEAEDKDRCVALLARAIATSDPSRAVALADAMQGPGNHRELVKTPGPTGSAPRGPRRSRSRPWRPRPRGARWP
jgi:hypothetical protein